jgi:hypothetical protein
MLFALLVSYYLNPHDLSLLLLPFFVLTYRVFARTPPRAATQWTILTLIAIPFLPPLQLWALRAGAYALVAIPMLVLFLSSGSLPRRSETSPVTLYIHEDQRED